MTTSVLAAAPGARVELADDGVAALRLLLMLTLTPREVAELWTACLPGRDLDGLWPSSRVADLALALVDEPSLWRAVAGVLEQRLAPWLAPIAARPLRESLALLSREGAADVPALAALVWSLVRRREAALAPVLARVVGELERVIVAEAGRLALQDMSQKSHAPGEPGSSAAP